jgi:uncharacterized membrane protein YqjE
MESGRTEGQARAGMFERVGAVARDIGALLRNRAELALLELGELRSNALKVLLLGALAVVAFWFALAYWSVLVVYLAWDALGWKILAIVAAAFTLAGVMLLRHIRAMISQGKLSMPATMTELRNDRDALF